MNSSVVLDWIWRYRKLLLLEALLLGLTELLYFLPTGLGWWVLILVVLAAVFSWWIGNARFNQAMWLLMAELLWVVLGGVGFLVFSLLYWWQAQLIIAVIILLTTLLTYWHQNHIDHQRWDLAVVNWLNLVDLLVLFVVTLSLLVAVQFYSLGVFWLMLGVGLQLILALYLVFWRQGLPAKKFWLYGLILALVGEQLVWITQAWHKSAYFKAFLLLIIYYLYSDFVAHYLRGNLTVRVTVKYIGIAFFLVIMLFIFDLIFLLVPNI